MKVDERVTLVVADDHPVVLDGIAYQFDGCQEFEVVGMAVDAVSTLNLVAEYRPDLILLDLRLGNVLAPELISKINETAPQSVVLVFTAFDDIALLSECWRAGVGGVMLKSTDGEPLASVARRVVTGARYLDPRLEDVVDVRMGNSEGEGRSGLTPREYEVLRLLASGMTASDIAGHLMLSNNTVRSYRQDLLTKLGCHSQIEAIAMARQLRLV